MKNRLRRSALAISLAVHLVLLAAVRWWPGGWRRENPAATLPVLIVMAATDPAETAAGAVVAPRSLPPAPAPAVEPPPAPVSKAQELPAAPAQVVPPKPEPRPVTVSPPSPPLSAPANVAISAVTNAVATNAVTGAGASPVIAAAPVAAPTTGEVVRLTGPVSYRKRAEPVYPALARQRRQQGAVLLLAMIDEAGRPASVEVTRSSGFPLLDQAAVEAVRQSEFAPGQSNGRPVPTEVEVPVTFRLR